MQIEKLSKNIIPKTHSNSVKGIIKIFYYCNSYCVFCHSEDNKIYKASLAKAKEKIDWAIDIGIDQILFSGGEPTIYSGFKELVEYAITKGLSTGIISNGRTLANEDLVYFLLKNKANYFYLSLHGYNAKLNDKITESEGSWQQAITGFKNLIRISQEKNIDIDLTINCVLTTENISTATEMVHFLHSIGIAKMKFSYPQSKGRAKEGNITWGIPTIEDAVKIIESCITLGSHLGIKVYYDGIPFCFFQAHYRLMVENLQTHRIFYMIEIYEKKWFETDEGPREKNSECQSCSFTEICNGYLEKSKFDKVKPISEPIPNYFSLYRTFEKEIEYGTSDQQVSSNLFCLKEDSQIQTKSLPQRRIFIQQEQKFICYEAEDNFFNNHNFLKAKEKNQLFYLPNNSSSTRSDNFSIFDLLKIKKKDHCNQCDLQCPGIYTLSQESYSNNLDPLRAYLNSLKGQGKILEIGCGELLLTKSLVDENYYAIEPNKDIFEACKREFPQGNFFHSGIENFNFENNFFDFVLLVGSYNHISILSHALDKIYKLLKKQAKVIIIENKLFGLLNEKSLPIHSDLVNQWGNYEHYRNHNALQAKESMLQYNFTINHCGDIIKNNNFWYIEAVK